MKVIFTSLHIYDKIGEFFFFLNNRIIYSRQKNTLKHNVGDCIGFISIL